MSDVDAMNAVRCSYLGLTARDVAEIGNFSERFARDLLAGRRPFPKDVQDRLTTLFVDLANIQEVMYEQLDTDESTIYIFRTVEQLRSSPIGRIWPLAFLGPYRVAAFEVMKRCHHNGRTIHLEFAETPVIAN